MVIYSSIGGLRYVSRIEDFPELKDNKEIPTTESGLRWRESSVYFLSEATQYFIILAPKNKPIVINIPHGFREYGFESSVIEAEIKKRTEHDGTRQPATRPESDSEGANKPQPESGGRSR